MILFLIISTSSGLSFIARPCKFCILVILSLVSFPLPDIDFFCSFAIATRFRSAVPMRLDTSLLFAMHPQILAVMGKLIRKIKSFNQISKILIGCCRNQETMGENLVFLGKANFHKLTFKTTHSKIFALHRYHRVQVL